MNARSQSRRAWGLAAGAFLAGAVLVTACQQEAPVAPSTQVGELQVRPNFWEGGGPASFRLTGGGRIDVPESEPTEKNTPESHDFATFGFQARPVAPGSTEGRGRITWVEHNPDAIEGGFTMHGVVTEFQVVEDITGRGGQCATFSGLARGRTRDGNRYENIPFVVEHACDRGEPGVDTDDIRLIIDGGVYDREGFLTGGNIQAHKLPGPPPPPPQP